MERTVHTTKILDVALQLNKDEMSFNGPQACLENSPDGSNDEDEEAKEGYDFFVPKGSTGVQTFHSMSEIASCSYEARKAGVKNGMFMGRALQLCPDLQTITYNFSEYNRISKVLYDLVASYTHDIEAVSCDEMLIDCTDILTDTGATAMEFARLLRTEMMEKTGCPASAGIGPNILLAKLATRRAKPNGQFEVVSSEARKFIEDQPVSDLPGVGYSLTRKLSKLDVQTCGQLQHVPVSVLRREFGPKTGEVLHRFSLGQDDRPVKTDKQRKSVSAEVNYGIRFSKEVDALTFLKELSGEVKRRLDAIQVKGRCITLKLMIRRPDAPSETAKFLGHGICNSINKSSNLPVATNDDALISREVISMYKSQKVSAQDVRGIGIQINKLEGTSSAGVSHASGHQSILNFTVAKPAASSPKANIVPTAKEQDTRSDLTLISDKRQEKGNVELASLALTNKTPAPNFDMNRHSSSSFVPSVSSCTSSSSSTSNMTALKNKFTDGGDRTPSLFSSSSSHNASARSSSSVSGKFATVSSDSSSSRWTNSNATSNACSGMDQDLTNLDRVSSRLSFQPGPSTSRTNHQSSEHLSLSQIDLDTLSELPADIAQEILTDLTHQKEQQSKSHNAKTANNNVKNVNSNSRQTAAHRDDHENNSALPALSQLNMSCFEALPESLQEEIRAEYARQEKEASEKNVEDNYFTRLISPHKGKHQQGQVTLRGSGHRGRRGRPPGKKKLNFSGSRVRSVEISKQGPRVAFSDAPHYVVCDDDEDENTNDGTGFTDQESSMDCVYGKKFESRPAHQGYSHSISNAGHHQPPTPSRRASLCGADRLEDLRPLLKEWLSSGSEPQAEDLALVIDFFTQLVGQRDLEMVFPLLKLMHR
ncbi:DNA repair protein rev1 [Plakobranchus ocellatus]|uniref:DNA repair protein REV1 n=1 Tax=Plakobranchus ocellatus TaxID=259542 RepID=A0AAV3XWY4_9GAST|nr:DNA repair protein rev1 [Plakobranchus ocellatus]